MTKTQTYDMPKSWQPLNS